jgi:hypothetical protein
MRLVSTFVLLIVSCVTILGCARTDTFNISVRNDTAGPLTLALTKNGPPFEHKWAAPEDLAIEAPTADEQHGYVVLPPGKEADVDVQGKFASSTRGYLRVYRGDLQISEMNAIGPTSSNRLDLPLKAGANRFVIADASGRLTEHRDSGSPSNSTARP